MYNKTIKQDNVIISEHWAMLEIVVRYHLTIVAAIAGKQHGGHIERVIIDAIRKYHNAWDSTIKGIFT